MNGAGWSVKSELVVMAILIPPFQEGILQKGVNIGVTKEPDLHKVHGLWDSHRYAVKSRYQLVCCEQCDPLSLIL